MAKKMKKMPAKKKAAKESAKKTKRVGKKSAAKKSAPKKSVNKAESGAGILSAGAKAPGFALPSDTGNTVRLQDFAGQTVVLYFYPKDDTPGCTQESCDFRDSFTRVQSKGAFVLGVSKDTVESHQRFKTKFSLPFPLLSDTSGRMLEAYKVWGEKSLYGRKFMGITRTTYVIDVDANGVGTIRKAYPKVKVGGHVDAILADLRSGDRGQD